MKLQSHKAPVLKIMRELGSGGMANIYLCEQEDGQQVVLKRLKPELANNNEATALFEDEIQTLRHLSDIAGVVTYLGDGADSEGRFLLMSYIDGPSLGDIPIRFGAQQDECPIKPTTETLLAIARALFTTLRRIHGFTSNGLNLNIIHRDLSPENILLDAHGGLSIIDFGVAYNMHNRRQTVLGEVKGKYAYMAPEQTLGLERLDQRVDIYAAGIILYELATGRAAFEGPTDADVINAVREGLDLDQGGHEPDIDKRIWAIIRLCISPDRDERFLSADEALSALEELFLEYGTSRNQRQILSQLVKDIQSDQAMRAQSAPTTSPRATVRVVQATTTLQGGDRPSKSLRWISGLTLIGGMLTGLIFWVTDNGMTPTTQRAGSAPESNEIQKSPINKTVSSLPTQTQPPSGPHNPETQNKPMTDGDRSEPRHVQSPEAQKAPSRAAPPVRQQPPKNTEPRSAGSSSPNKTTTNAQVGMGTISINSEPWAYVYIDGKATGRVTPLVRYELSSGTHTVTVRAPEHGLEESVTFQLAPDSDFRKFFKFNK